jgi:hypothetical protein
LSHEITAAPLQLFSSSDDNNIFLLGSSKDIKKKSWEYFKLAGITGEKYEYLDLKKKCALRVCPIKNTSLEAP